MKEEVTYEHLNYNCGAGIGKPHCSEACSDPTKEGETICQCHHLEWNCVGLTVWVAVLCRSFKSYRIRVQCLRLEEGAQCA